MALSPTRMEYRIALSHLDRGRTLDEAVIVGRHPSETMEHLTLRVLAWCLFSEERLEFGPGLSTPEAPDLWTRDLTGRLTTWIECGAADPEKVRRVVQQNHGLQLHARKFALACGCGSSTTSAGVPVAAAERRSSPPRREERVEEASILSFPASDPPAH